MQIFFPIPLKILKFKSRLIYLNCKLLTHNAKVSSLDVGSEGQCLHFTASGAFLIHLKNSPLTRAECFALPEKVWAFLQLTELGLLVG